MSPPLRRSFHLLAGVVIVACLLSSRSEAAGWTYERSHEHDLDQSEYKSAGRYGCGLLELYGPSSEPHELRVNIPKSPYGPLQVWMSWERRLRIEVSEKRFPKRPSDETFQKVFEWLISELPESPKPCQRYLAKPTYAVVEIVFPGESRLVSDVEYVALQMQMAGLAMQQGKPELATKLQASAYYMFSSEDIDNKERRQLKKDPKLREAAYTVVATKAPEGIVEDVRKGYCSIYEFARTAFPPRSKEERQLFRTRERELQCRKR